MPHHISYQKYNPLFFSLFFRFSYHYNIYQKTEFLMEDFVTICNQKKKEFENEVKNFPGDKFFISIIQDPESINEGFVVNLRRIKEIKRDEISIRYFGSTPYCFVL